MLAGVWGEGGEGPLRLALKARATSARCAGEDKGGVRCLAHSQDFDVARQAASPACIRQGTEDALGGFVVAGLCAGIADGDEAPGIGAEEDVGVFLILEKPEHQVELPPEDRPAEGMHVREEGRKVWMLTEAAQRDHGTEYTPAPEGWA